MNRFSRSLSTALVPLLALLTTSTAAVGASVGASGFCSVAHGNNSFTTCNDANSIALGGGSWEDSRFGTANAASWSGSGSVGLLKSTSTARASTLAPAFANPLTILVNASTSVGWQDNITFGAPGLAGQNGIFRATMLLDGILSGSSSNNELVGIDARWNFNFGLVADRRFVVSQSFGSRYQINFLGTNGDPLVHQAIELTAPIVFGKSYLMTTNLGTTASSNVRPKGLPGEPEYFLPVSGSASANFGSTATWEGIQSVTLADGSPVTGWNVTSTSGFDYSRPFSVLTPVPEPATAALMGAGLIALTLVARRRQSQPFALHRGFRADARSSDAQKLSPQKWLATIFRFAGKHVSWWPACANRKSGPSVSMSSISPEAHSIWIPSIHDYDSRERKRAIRRSPAPLQAHH